MIKHTLVLVCCNVLPFLSEVGHSVEASQHVCRGDSRHVPSDLCHTWSYVYGFSVGLWNLYVREEPSCALCCSPEGAKCIRKMWFGVVSAPEVSTDWSRRLELMTSFCCQSTGHLMVFGNVLKGIKELVVTSDMYLVLLRLSVHICKHRILTGIMNNL